jgi:hypothetical protein
LKVPRRQGTKGPRCLGPKVPAPCGLVTLWPCHLLVLCLVLAPVGAMAQPINVKKTVSLLAGAATGLVVHEAGHVATSAMFGARPDTKPIRYAGIPFFAVTHDPVSRKKEFVISSAGFWMQHAGSEWLLTARPDLRHESAPFLKGVLAFNLATSAMYSVAAFGEIGPPERDPRGVASSLGRKGWPEPVIGALILAPALLDGIRYVWPDQRWAVWTSRGLKAAFMALTLVAGRPLA